MQIFYSNQISWQLLDEIVYIIDEITQKEYQLTEVGKEFWMLIREHNDFEKIVDILTEKYNISKKVFVSDLIELIDNLVLENLLIKGV